MYVDRISPSSPWSLITGDWWGGGNLGPPLALLAPPGRKAGEEARRRSRSAPLAQRTEAGLTLEPPCSGSRSRDQLHMPHQGFAKTAFVYVYVRPVTEHHRTSRKPRNPRGWRRAPRPGKPRDVGSDI